MQRELWRIERERAFFELKRRWRGGVEWPKTSKLPRLILHINILDVVIADPKERWSAQKEEEEEKEEVETTEGRS